MRISGLRAFLLWGFAGALYGLAVLSLASIGLFILPVAVVITAIAVRRLEVWPAILGIVLGPAAAMMRLGSFSSGLRRCGAGEQVYLQAAGSASALTRSATIATHVDGCANTNFQQWVWIGVVLAVVTLALYTAVRFGLATRRRPG